VTRFSWLDYSIFVVYLAGAVSVGELAKRAHMGRAHFIRKFVLLVNQPIESLSNHFLDMRIFDGRRGR